MKSNWLALIAGVLPLVSAQTTADGSLYTAQGPFSELTRDLRASRKGDLLNIVVLDRASAVARGTATSQRKSSAKANIDSVGGPVSAWGWSGDLLRLSADRQLQGQGATSRDSVVSTTLTGVVSDVLPNGDLVVEAEKVLKVNGEMQTVMVRGIVRPFDITLGNMVRSERLAQLEIRLNGKGVVGDAVKRPHFLYRLLLGILPF